VLVFLHPAGEAAQAQGGGGTITELLPLRGVLGQLGTAASSASCRSASRKPLASPTWWQQGVQQGVQSCECDHC
jgi:hypothetical protein